MALEALPYLACEGMVHELNGNLEWASEIYMTGASRSDSFSSFLLGRLYRLNGEYAKFKACMESSACSSAIIPQSLISFEFGESALQRSKFLKAAFHFQTSLELGNIEAAIRLGSLYENEEFEEQNTVSSYRFYRIAAQRGRSEAKYAMANIIIQGLIDDTEEPIDEDPIQLLQSAAEQSHSLACLDLARCYESGISVDADAALAFDYYKRASALNNSIAHFTLFKWFQIGRAPVGESVLQAVRYLRLANQARNEFALKLVDPYLVHFAILDALPLPIAEAVVDSLEPSQLQFEAM